MAQWEGKAKGTPLGYKIFIFFIRNFGINAAYTILLFVAAYYFFFSFSTTRTSYFYFRRRLQQSVFRSLVNVYKNYFVFGQTLIDRTAISFGFKDKFSFTYNGKEKVQMMLDQRQGGVIFSAHIGSFNIARYFIDEFEMEGTAIHLMVTDVEREQIKQYVGAVSNDTAMKFIVIQEDMSHIFTMNEVLMRGEVIIFAADRYIEGIQFLQHDFLGKAVKFPSGPYKLAARRKVPVLFLYIMKGEKKQYHLYARSPQFEEGTAIKPSHILGEYVRNLELMIQKHPLQWFNYYDFWEDLKG